MSISFFLLLRPLGFMNYFTFTRLYNFSISEFFTFLKFDMVGVFSSVSCNVHFLYDKEI